MLSYSHTKYYPVCRIGFEIDSLIESEIESTRML